MGSRLGQVQAVDQAVDQVEDQVEDRVEDRARDQHHHHHYHYRQGRQAIQTHQLYNLPLRCQSFGRRTFCSHREL